MSYKDEYKTIITPGFVVHSDSQIVPVKSSPTPHKTPPTRQQNDILIIPVAIIVILLGTVIGLQVSLFGQTLFNEWEYQNYLDTKTELQRLKECIK